MSTAWRYVLWDPKLFVFLSFVRSQLYHNVNWYAICEQQSHFDVRTLILGNIGSNEMCRALAREVENMSLGFGSIQEKCYACYAGKSQELGRFLLVGQRVKVASLCCILWQGWHRQILTCEAWQSSLFGKLGSRPISHSACSISIGGKRC